MGILLIGLILVVLNAGSSLQAKADPMFPDPFTISISQREPLLFQKTGESIRRAYFVQVYRIAHYADKKSGESNILDYQGHKAVSMVFMRKINGPRIQAEVKKAIRDRISPDEWIAVKDSASIFCEPFSTGAVKKGDEYSVVWFPDGRVVNKFNGKEIGGIQDQRFARALWNIWVGEKSLVDAEDLLGAWYRES